MIHLLKFMRKKDFLYMFIIVTIGKLIFYWKDKISCLLFKSAFNFIPDDWFTSWKIYKKLSVISNHVGISIEMIVHANLKKKSLKDQNSWYRIED